MTNRELEDALRFALKMSREGKEVVGILCDKTVEEIVAEGREKLKNTWIQTSFYPDTLEAILTGRLLRRYFLSKTSKDTPT